MKNYLKLISIIIFISICFLGNIILTARGMTPTPMESPSVSPHKSLTPKPTNTPVVIMPPVPLSTRMPGDANSSLPTVQKIDEATVMLYYRPIIKIYSDSGLSASERAYILERRLEEVLARTHTTPFVKINTVDGTPVLESEGIYLISVTNNDASYNNTSAGQVAALWRDELEKGLEIAMKEQSKDYEKEALRCSLIAIVTGVMLSIITLIIWHRWLKKIAYLNVFLIWLIVIAYILWVFPTSRSWAKGIATYVLHPIVTLSLIVIIIKNLINPLDHFIKHCFDLEKKFRGHEIDDDARAIHRLTMYKLVISTFVQAGLYIIGGFIFLKSLHIDLATGLAGAGIIGVGIGLAAQDLLKDILAGTFIVLEDQFAIGDFIKTGDVSGTVEGFNMRVTRIRDMGGCLITIPNSYIRTVQNFSSTWSQIDCIVNVTYDTDLKKAMDIMLETGNKLKEDYPDKILEEPIMLGVNELTDSGAKLRMILKTAPNEQWQLKRELFLRIKNKFDKNGIAIAIPQLNVKFSEGNNSVIGKENPATSRKKR